MDNRFAGKKAEDILTDDLLLEDFKVYASSNLKEAEEPELWVVHLIYRSIHEGLVPLSFEEKEYAGEKIAHSIFTCKRRNFLLKVTSVAAIVVFVIGLFIWIVPEQNTIADFASNIDIKPTTGDTRLILNGKEEIQIKSKDSKIEYTGIGEEIQIDASRKVEQQIDEKETVFNTIVVPYGRRTEIVLSDNTKIWLNSGSKLIYPAHFLNSKREVFLEGEGVFEVSRDKKKPFFVITRDIEVKVLGTVFNVSAYADDPYSSTVLEKGSVELKYNGGGVFKQSKIKMTPGMLAMYSPDSKSIQQHQVDTRDYTCWKDGYIILHNESLNNITKKLSRYYNIPILIESRCLENKTFSGNLDLKNSAIMVLNIIKETTEITLKEEDGKIIIKEE